MEIPEGYGQVTIGFTGTMAPTGAAVTYGINIQLPIIAGQLDEIADEAAASFMARFGPAMTNQITLSSVLVKAGPTDTGPSVEKGYNLPGASGNAGGYPGVSYLVSKNTAFGGRAGRGRMFIPGVPEASVDPGGNLSSGTTAGLQTAANDWLADQATNGVPVYLLHNAGGPLTEPTEVTSLTVSNRSATQRRRNRR